MRYVRDLTGRFAERPHYEHTELDVTFERLIVEFLKLRHGKVEFPVSTDDLTVLIERDTGDLDAYADLTSYGRGVEGVTEFRPGKKPIVKISQHLGSSESRENRFRTTLTHEFGHVHLHGYLFETIGGGGGDLFDRGAKPGVIACKRENMIQSAKSDWMEWQAGYACGALLMPASRVRHVADSYRKDAGIYGSVLASGAQGQIMIDLIVERFQVSRDAARVRLNVLGFLGAPQTVGLLPL